MRGMGVWVLPAMRYQSHSPIGRIGLIRPIFDHPGGHKVGLAARRTRDTVFFP
jgi:hypothetical protein